MRSLNKHNPELNLVENPPLTRSLVTPARAACTDVDCKQWSIVGVEWLPHHCLQWCVAAPSAGINGSNSGPLVLWGSSIIIAFGFAFGDIQLYPDLGLHENKCMKMSYV